MTETQLTALKKFINIAFGDALTSGSFVLDTVDVQEAFLVNNDYALVEGGLDKTRYGADYTTRKAAITAFEQRSRAIHAMETSLNMIFQTRRMMFQTQSRPDIIGIATEIGCGAIKEFFTSADSLNTSYIAFIDGLANRTDTPKYTKEGVIEYGTVKKNLSVINRILRVVGDIIDVLPSKETHDFVYDNIAKYENGVSFYLDIWLLMAKDLETRINDFKKFTVEVPVPIDPADQTILDDQYQEIFRIFTTFLFLNIYLS